MGSPCRLCTTGRPDVFAIFQFAASNQDSVFAKYSVKQSLRSRLIVGLTFAGTVPVMALMFLLAERSANLRLERLSGRIDETAGSMAYAVDRYLDKHVAGINSVASAISASGDFSRESITRSLLLHHALYMDFLTMLAADENGDIVAATSLMLGPLRPVNDLAGHNVADREYFKAPMSNGRSCISDPFQGRSLGSDPIVAISAPLYDETGEFVGVVEGSMNLGAFKTIDGERPEIDGAITIVADRNDQVIYATGDANLESLGSIANSALVAEAARHGPRDVFDFVHSQNEQRARHVGVYANTANGWRVFLRAPVERVTAQMLGDYKVGVTLLLLV